MGVSPGLFPAILAMDSYNRGYSAGIAGLSDSADTQIGNATVDLHTDNTEGSAERNAGFYAISYTWNGQTVISYRGTDNPSLFAGSTSQTSLAMQFYRWVTGRAIGSGPAVNTFITGQALGGGLAGLAKGLH